MSHELLVLVGPPHREAQERRAVLVGHAARAVPGSASVKRVESVTTVAAVVATTRAGGTVTQVASTAGGTRVSLALGATGLLAAESDVVHGAEGAHATVLLAEAGSVAISADGAGAIPFYWWADGETLIASTHLATLVSLGAPAVADERGVVEYLTFHHPLGTRTILAGAQQLEAGAVLEWDRTAHRVRRRRALFELSQTPPRTDEAVLDDFAQTWEQVIADAFADGGRVGISLSGGMDSRTIAGEAARQGRAGISFTYGDTRSAEVRVAVKVAEALHLPHLSIPVRDADVLAGARETLAHLDGAHSPNEMYDTWFTDVLRTAVDTVVNGHAGDPQWGNAKGIGLTDRDAVRGVLWNRYRAYAAGAARFLEGDLGQKAETLAQESLVASLEGADFSTRGDGAVAWAMEHRQRRWGNMLITALRRTGLRPQTPFLDRRFLALSSTFSPKQRLNGALYLRAQKTLFDATAEIPRSDDGNAPRGLSHLYWSSDTPRIRQLAGLAARHPVSGSRRGANHGLDLVLGRAGRYAGGADLAARRALDRAVFPSDAWLRERPVYALRLQALLQEPSAALVSGEAVEQTVRSIASGAPDAPAPVLGRVAALNGWLADYQEREAARRPLMASSVRSRTRA